MTWIQPIYDRTEQDVNNLKALASQIKAVGWSNATQSQRDEWLLAVDQTVKGALNHTDLNRIQANVDFLKNKLFNDFGIYVSIDQSNPVWGIGDEIFLSNIDRIRDNINALLSEGYSPAGAPVISYVDNPDYGDINDLEENLYLLYVLLNRIPLFWQNCGAFNCGQSGIL